MTRPQELTSSSATYLPGTRKRFNYANLAILHLLTTGLITMGIIGTTGLRERADGTRDSKPILQRLGYIGLLVVTVVTFVELCYFYRWPLASQIKFDTRSLRPLRSLLFATLASLALTMMRLASPIAQAFELDQQVESLVSVTIVELVLEIGATIALLVGGTLSRDVKRRVAEGTQTTDGEARGHHFEASKISEEPRAYLTGEFV